MKQHAGFDINKVLERNRSDSREHHPDAQLVRKYIDILEDPDVELVIVVFGMPCAIFADVLAQRTGSQIDDSFDIHMHYDDVKWLVRGSYLVKVAGPRYILHGTKGSFLKY